MKKLLSFFIVLAMLLTALVGCVKKDNAGDTPDDAFIIPEGLSGTDVIKLLLASQRLDSQLLKNEGDIFENGVEVMQTLASRAKANLRGATYVSKTHEANRGGKVEIDGNTFTWSDFEENCNSYDYFENITQNIVFSAEQGAQLIDNTKKYVRIVDKWVAIGEEKYYLHVDEDSETIYSLIGGQLNICKRHRNDNGENVYELYFSNEIAETRMLYVPGVRYEWSEKFGENNAQYFIADNSKGFWETFVVGEFPDQYNISCFVMKNDICYDAFYSPASQTITLLKTMSSDRKTDILFFNEYGDTADVTLQLGGFDGIENIEIKSSPDKIADTFDNSTDNTTVIYNSDPSEPYATTTGTESAIINLENGGRIEAEEVYANGMVQVGRTLVQYGSGIYTAELELSVSGANDEEKFANLKAFLEETGLECRRNIDGVLGGIRRAYVELDGFIDYYKWHGFKIKTDEAVANAILEEDKLFDKMSAMFTKIKDAEVVDFSDKEAVELNISFSPVTVSAIGNAEFENMAVSVSGLMLTVTDTTLFVKGQAYIVNFALVKKGGNNEDIVHISTDSPTEIVYTDTDSFTVGTASATVEIPTLTEGEYTLVSYVATSDKIRASKYVPVVFKEISTDSINLEGVTLTPAKNEKGEILLAYVENIDVRISLASPEDLDYASLRDLLAEEAYKYGVASDVPVEKQNADDEGFSALTGDETVIESGVYRLAYSVQNGDVTLNGYIYAEYLAPEAEQ